MRLACVLISILYYYSISSAFSWNEETFKFKFDDGRLVLPDTTKETLKECRNELAAISDDNIPNDISEGILLDGQVLSKLPNDKFGQPSWLIKCKHIYLAKKVEPSENQLILKSPLLKDGGVFLKRGGQYRIFAFPFGTSPQKSNGQLYIWSTSVLRL